MRILYHHRIKSRDGQYIHIRSLIDAFRRQGHEVMEVGLTAGESLYMGEESRFWKRFVELLPSPVFELLEYLYSLPAALWLWLKILRHKPDFLYERYALGNFAGVLASRWSHVPILLEVNSPLAREKQATGNLHFASLARASEKRILQWASRILVVSQVLKDIYIQEGIDPDKIVVIPNGIHLDQYEHRNGGAFRERYRLGDATVIGFVGFFRPWHRLNLILELMAGELADLNMRLLLVGDGPARQELEHDVEELNLGGQVIWTGILRHEEVPDALDAMDIALQPAVTTYSSPLKLFEYMAAGKAIVAPNRSNIEEIIQDGINGLLFEPGDLKTMGEALRRLVQDPELRMRLGAAARKRLEQGGFTWDANVGQVLAELEKVWSCTSA